MSRRWRRSNKLLTRVAILTLAGVACEAAITADVIQRTWGVIDEIAQATLSRTYFGPQAPLNDQKGCADISITRQQPLLLASHQNLIDLFYGS